MGLDSMRGSYYGRCPPILVGALVLICLILMFNWWSLSAQNYDLIKQLDDLSEQLRISSEEQERCARQRSSFENQVKSLEEEIAQLRVKLDQQRTDNEEYKKQLSGKDDEIKSALKTKDDCQGASNRCTTELESLKKLDISKDGVIASLRLEKEQLISQVDKYKDKIQKLEEDLVQSRAALATLKHADNVKQPAAATVPVMKLGFVRTVDIEPKGMTGMIFHKEPILPRDPPDAQRPLPRLSVTNLNTASSAKIGVAVGGEAVIPRTDLGDNDDNHAAEREDEPNGEGEDAQIQDDLAEIPPDDDGTLKRVGTEMISTK